MDRPLVIEPLFIKNYFHSNYGGSEFDVATCNFGGKKCIFVNDNLLLLDNAMFFICIMYASLHFRSHAFQQIFMPFIVHGIICVNVSAYLVIGE